MSFIFQETVTVEKIDSNVDGLKYLPNIIGDGLNDRDWVFKFKSQSPRLK